MDGDGILDSAAQGGTTESPSFLDDGGEMGALIRAHDWAASPLGRVEDWPQSLRTTIGILLTSRHAMCLAWGPDLTFLYNDTYAPFLGARHPTALGRPFAEVWSDVWSDIGPLVASAMAGEATWSEELHLVMHRSGYPEDTWWSFSYSPVRDEGGGVAGMLNVCADATARVLAERRHQFRVELIDRLRMLSRPEEVIATATEMLGTYLGVDCVGYSEVDERGELATVDRDWTADCFVSVVGTHRLADYGSAMVDRLSAGRTVRIDDVTSDPLTAGAEATYAAISTRAFVDAPLVKSGRLGGILFVLSSTPRVWTDSEVTLIEEVADRTWAAVERARVEAELRESEVRFHRIADSAPVPMWVTLADRTRGFVNRAYVDFLGVSYEESVDFDWRRIIHPEDHDRIVAESIAGEASLEPFHLIGRYRRADGEWRWLHSISQPRLGPDGEPVGFIGVAHDITDAKEAETDLRASEERLKLVQAAGKIGSFDYDLQADDAVCSPEYYAIHGLAPGAPINRESWTAIIHPDDRGGAIDALRRAAVERRSYRHEYRIVRADTGEARWLSGRAEVIFDKADQPWRFVGGVIDITERRMAEEAARASEAQLRTITDALPVLIAYVDTDERYRFVNQAYEDWFGRPRDAVLGKTIAELVGDEAYPRLAPFIARALMGERFAYESTIPHRDGGARAVHIDYIPARADNGDVLGYYALVQDIAERKAAEDALRELNETLESRVIAETGERLRAEESLRQAQKMEAIGQLTGGIAHDFNNLLTIILNSVELLGREGISDARRDRYIAAIGETAERAATLTSQLLSFARRQPLTSEAFDLCERVRGMKAMLQTVLGSRIRLTIESDGVCCVKADPNQFDTAVLNMAVNARDAMPAGGRLTVAAAVTPDGKDIELRVADTGTGIAPDQLESIFEPFFTTKGVGKGTGLGLSQVYGFARQSGGDVRVESMPGEGSTFILSLPHAPRRGGDRLAERAPLPPPELAAILGQGRVLVVEDNSDVGEFGGQLLEELGYSVVHVGDAEAALDRIANDPEPFDLVFSDVVMPGEMDGLALARRLAAERPGLPVILTTGYAHALVDDRTHGFEVLRKPYSLTALSRVLHEKLGKG